MKHSSAKPDFRDSVSELAGIPNSIGEGLGMRVIVSIPKLGLGNESLYLFSLCLCAFVAKGFSDEK